MKLYGVRGWGSGIVEIMLSLSKIEYEFVDVTGFDKDGSPRTKLLAVNPLAQVPTLVLKSGQVMTETAAIALMLIDRVPDLAPPAGTQRREEFYQLLIWLVANVYPTFTYGDYPHRWSPSAQRELRSATDHYRQKLFLWLETKVTAPFAMGEQVTAIDAYLSAMTSWRPGAAWFSEHCPKILECAHCLEAVPLVTSVIHLNGWSHIKGD